ncbi:glycoside hydrolase family 78 protein [Zasmidium cellare ATCC 36951]|uniref:alpha-L-rhamnosidase n=1 Tax=Zasmidium cellare ATCC 36951 TaxID=1080233 RepID=A0A6A6CD50_ZASCE|nr:glycoside hydrolase family 78 protein [Zasmidium cellare ATCC 36951]KAF2165015.1 glycoside hydrolase family 78 protein [Zasmidium cellare ATCC 36951]
MEVVNCGIHGFHEVLGIDIDEISFHWSLESQEPDAVQEAYQIVLIKGLEFDLSTGSVAWDTGRVASPAQRNIPCRPKDGLDSTCNYWWRVSAWNQRGEVFHSRPNYFFTAYSKSRHLPPWSMNQTYMPHTSLIFRTWFEDELNRWKGVWLGDGGDKPLYLRKTFSLERIPSRAIAFASGLGHFNLSVNGEPPSDHVLDPGWTNYHRTVQFVGYDLTPHLAEGTNAIGAHVGNGFYAGDQGDRFFWPNYEDQTYVRHGNELCFFCELHFFYDDGTHDVVLSGPDWKTRQSATSLANIYASETHDRMAYPLGWDTSAFDDSQWVAAKPVTGPRGELRYQHQPPVVLHETFHPISTKTLKPGIVAFDLGQNSSIMPKISIKGDAGSEVIIRYAETVDDQGFVLMPDPLFKEFETHVYSKIVLAGTGDFEVWQPDFSFTSARYIQVEGVSLEAGQSLPLIESAVGQHVSSAARCLGSVRTDRDDVNQLINACYWTYSSNLFSYHTDCPQIEKFGWLEVTHLLFPATQYVRDIEALHSKILEDILDAQEPSGFIPNMAPDTRFMCGPMRNCITWSCAVCFIPDLLKKYYGVTHMIKKVYPSAVRFVEYMQSWERKGGLIMHGLGDWGRDIAFGNLQANIETAVYHKCVKCLEMMAIELGKAGDAERFKTWAAEIYSVYNDHLLVTNDPEHPQSYYTSLDDHPRRDRHAVAQAIALQFGMVPAEHIADVQKTFLADVADGVMRSGEIGLRYLFITLDDLRRPDLVLKMARQEDHPSYMRFLRRGETTLLEFWQDDCRSKCHDMLGTIYEWFYAAVLGIKPIEDAYRTFSIRPPYESEFDEVQGNVDCPYGQIKVHFRRERDAGKVLLDLVVPVSTTATLELPDLHVAVLLEPWKGPKLELGSNERRVKISHGKYIVTMEGV